MTQIINKYILPNELSIHFFENGFSFCTNSKINFNPIISDKEDLKVLLKENLDFYPKGSFEVYSVVFFQSPSTFVPQKFFDPKKYHLIMFDQRGCGKSTPYGETTENTTSDLISDINLILDNLSIDKINIYGGSWGSTLALLYAESNPERVATLILRGVFLCRRDDIRWFYQHGASEIYPHYWEKYLSLVSKSKRNDILTAYYEMIHSSDEIVSKRACKEWSLWEGRSSCLLPSREVINAFDECAISLAKIESHYFINNCFIEENQILKNIKNS